MDQRFHRRLHLGAPRRHELRMLRQHRSRRLAQQFDALSHYLGRLAHLLDAAEITVVTIAILADRNLELQFVVSLVGLRAAQIPGQPRAAHHHAGKAPLDHVLLRDDANIDVALLEDAVVGEQPLDVVDDARELHAPGVDVLDQRRRQILVHPARAHIIGMEPRTRRALIEHHQLFAFFEAPERGRQRADVHRLRRHVEQMIEDAADLGIEHANDRRAARHFNAGELLDGQAERVLLVHRRDVIQPIEIRDRLQVRFVLHQLFGAAVQQADMRIDALDDLTVELENQTQHAVRSRVLRAEIDRERPLLFGRRCGDVGDAFSHGSVLP